MYKKKTIRCSHCGNGDPDQQQDIVTIVNGRRVVTEFKCLMCGVVTPVVDSK